MPYDRDEPGDRDNVIMLPGLRGLEAPSSNNNDASDVRRDDAGEPGAAVYEEMGRAAPPSPRQLVGVLEAVLFSASEPLSFERLHAALCRPEAGALRGALTALRRGCEIRASGFRLVEVAGGYQLRTASYAASYVSRARGVKPVKLSKAAVETLSIVAYRQPVTRQEVEGIRGVDCGGMLRMVLERGLLKVLGRRDEPGRPLVYGTTAEFLSMFDLRDLSDLPTLRDLRELQSDDARSGPVPVSPMHDHPDDA
jgi:segregation and condensation protein B